MKDTLITGEYVLKKATPSLCLELLTNNLPLNLFIFSSDFSFCLKSHLQPIVSKPLVSVLNFNSH